MLKDAAQCDVIARAFVDDATASAELSALAAPELRVTVLTQGHWPQCVCVRAHIVCA
jgi:hypothetical protein